MSSLFRSMNAFFSNESFVNVKSKSFRFFLCVKIKVYQWFLFGSQDSSFTDKIRKVFYRSMVGNGMSYNKLPRVSLSCSSLGFSIDLWRLSWCFDQFTQLWYTTDYFELRFSCFNGVHWLTRRGQEFLSPENIVRNPGYKLQAGVFQIVLWEHNALM